MRGLTSTCTALAAVLAATAALAEVRLVGGAGGQELAVEIATTPRGPWTPTGEVNDRVLNPSGDLFGDSMPGWDTRGDHVLSAWIRPGDGMLQRAFGEEPGWAPLLEVGAPGAVGQPVVDVLQDGWSVAWQEVDSSEDRVLITGTALDGEVAPPLFVHEGRLLGTWATGHLVHVITLNVQTGALTSTTVSFAFVPTQPIPIQLQIIEIVALRHGGDLGGGLLKPNGKPLRHPAQDGLSDPRIHERERRDGSGVGLVTWWEGKDLHGVEMGDDGPILPGLTLHLRGSSTTREDLLEQILAEMSE